jgi:hypothetical protein
MLQSPKGRFRAKTYQCPGTTGGEWAVPEAYLLGLPANPARGSVAFGIKKQLFDEPLRLKSISEEEEYFCDRVMV